MGLALLADRHADAIQVDPVVGAGETFLSSPVPFLAAGVSREKRANGKETRSVGESVSVVATSAGKPLESFAMLGDRCTNLVSIKRPPV